MKPKANPICRNADTQCGVETERVYAAPGIVIKGAAFKNNYDVPQSNAELGMPSEYELSREFTKPPEYFISAADLDLKKDFDAGKEAKKEAARVKAEKVKQTNPELYKNFRNAQDKARQKLKDKKK